MQQCAAAGAAETAKLFPSNNERKSMSEHLHEECGVFGVFAPETMDVAALVYYGLYALQHRGQEGAGIAVNDDGLFHYHKDLGLVADVFTPEVMERLGQGNMAVGHTRYGTTGSNARANCQPMVVNHIKGRMALVHNGNIVNASALRKELELKGSIFHTTSDTEVISYTITAARLTSPSIESALSGAMERLDGAYSLVLMSPSKLIAARDPRGFRPLCYGRMPDGSYAVSSESCALDAVGAELVRSIDPGEIVIFGKEGVHEDRRLCGNRPALCVFEYIYFARPDSVIEGASVHAARLRAGRFLAQESPVDADVVIGVPDSGIDAALGYAQESGCPYGVGFLKNKYIGRSFIAPDQSMRETAVKIKLNVIAETVRGKRVVLIDDSIVRGTTSERIVRLLRESGAREVHMRISSPPFRYPCFFGTDVDSGENLIACRLHSEKEIAAEIGADSLAYLSVEAAHHLAGGHRDAFCDGCFTGCYPIDIPEDQGKSRFEQPIIQYE